MATPVKTGSGLKPSTEFSHGTLALQLSSFTFPIAASLRRTAYWTSYRTQLNIDAFSSMLRAHGIATRFEEPSTPRRGYVDSSWERRIEIRYSRLAILQNHEGRDLLSRTPKGLSCKQIPGKLSLGMVPVLPTQGPPSHPTPVVKFTFSSSVN